MIALLQHSFSGRPPQSWHTSVIRVRLEPTASSCEIGRVSIERMSMFARRLLGETKSDHAQEQLRGAPKRRGVRFILR